ncbi:hypothetical protein CU098_010429, partial [Rhizopus stolonifer]
MTRISRVLFQHLELPELIFLFQSDQLLDVTYKAASSDKKNTNYMSASFTALVQAAGQEDVFEWQPEIHH